VSNDLLTIDDLALTLGLKRETVRDRIVKRADFPRPAVSLSQKIRRWSEGDVTEWLSKHYALNQR